MTTLFNDLKYSLRQLAKSPGFTIVAVLSLAIGIGANTAIFSIINGVLFKTLPVRNPQELRVINWAGSKTSLRSYSGSGKRLSSGMQSHTSFSYPLYCRLRDEAQGFSEVFAYYELANVTTLVRGTAASAVAVMVSGNFFSGYGVEPMLGRTIVPADEEQNPEPVAVVTYRFWEKHFRLDAQVLGHVISLNENSFIVVGVLPKDYVGPLAGDDTDIYVPLNTPSGLLEHSLISPDDWWVSVMARLAPGAKDSQAKASCEVIFRQALIGSESTVENPIVLLEDGSRGPLITRERVVKPFWMLLGAIGLVLLIACTNVAGMLLSRGTARCHEMAIRAAIGARRSHLLRQSLIESLLLSGLATVLGLVLSLFITQFVARLNVGLYGFNLSIDGKVLLYTVGLSLGTTLLFGLFPAWRISGIDPLVSMGSARILGNSHMRLGKVLVAAQIGLSLVLVVFAGLLVQTWGNLKQTNPGFDTENLLTFSVNAEEAGYQERQSVDFYDRLQQALAALPGMSTVSFANDTLLTPGYGSQDVTIAGRPTPLGQARSSIFLCVGDNFFPTLKIPLWQGRDFRPNNASDTTPEVIINQRFAQLFFPNENPLGHLLNGYHIVGVCGDVKSQTIRSVMEPTMYFHHRQYPMYGAVYYARTVLPPLSLSATVRKIVGELDDTIPVNHITTQTLLIQDTLGIERLSTLLCVSLGVLGLLLAVVGLYSLITFTVTRRTLEIGLRMALGAGPGDIARPILKQALVLSLIGIAVGLPVALLAARFLQSIVYGVQTHDPVTLALAAGILLAVTLLAAWIPARRAARVDPMVALRYE